MAFRKSWNRHDVWRQWCAENPDLLSGLPSFAIASEKAFRTLVTKGRLEDGTQVESVALADLSPKTLADVWRFIRYRTEFDMDASTFDALNEQVAERVPVELLGPVRPGRKR